MHGYVKLVYESPVRIFCTHLPHVRTFNMVAYATYVYIRNCHSLGKFYECKFLRALCLCVKVLRTCEQNHHNFISVHVLRVRP